MEILTITELGAMLKMSPRQIYSMTDSRGQAKDHPLPFFKINGNIRFRKPDIEAWLAVLAGEKQTV
jgi:predicted DNA-binding transcriptional regulator AlpA